MYECVRMWLCEWSDINVVTQKHHIHMLWMDMDTENCMTTRKDNKQGETGWGMVGNVVIPHAEAFTWPWQMRDQMSFYKQILFCITHCHLRSAPAYSCSNIFTDTRPCLYACEQACVYVCRSEVCLFHAGWIPCNALHVC